MFLVLTALCIDTLQDLSTPAHIYSPGHQENPDLCVPPTFRVISL